MLGFIHDVGRGVPQTGRKEAASVKYRLSAEQGDAYAQWMLGKLYFRGGKGSRPRLCSSAHVVFNLAASNGLTEAIEKGDAIVTKMSAV